MSGAATERRERIWRNVCIASSAALFLAALLSLSVRGSAFQYALDAVVLYLCMGPAGIVGDLMFCAELHAPMVILGLATFVAQWFVIWWVGRSCLRSSPRSSWVFITVAATIYIVSGAFALWFAGNVL
ncbi:MAG: hypothetical protein ACYSU0_09485 [Planctomycetota bacterium]|jgi:hypothetical protein